MRVVRRVTPAIHPQTKTEVADFPREAVLSGTATTRRAGASLDLLPLPLTTGTVIHRDGTITVVAVAAAGARDIPRLAGALRADTRISRRDGVNRKVAAIGAVPRPTTTRHRIAHTISKEKEVTFTHQ